MVAAGGHGASAGGGRAARGRDRCSQRIQFMPKDGPEEQNERPISRPWIRECAPSARGSTRLPTRYVLDTHTHDTYSTEGTAAVRTASIATNVSDGPLATWYLTSNQRCRSVIARGLQ